MSLSRFVATGIALVVAACLVWPDYSYGRSSRGGSHLYVLLGLGNNSPGVSEFGHKIGRSGVPTTVKNHAEWQELAQEATQQYKSGRLRSIMIIGHSLGGSAAAEMASYLNKEQIPVQLVVMLDPVGGSDITPNVRRFYNFRPVGNEDHSTVIAAHERDMTALVLGGKLPRTAIPGNVTPSTSDSNPIYGGAN